MLHEATNVFTKPKGIGHNTLTENCRKCPDQHRTVIFAKPHLPSRLGWGQLTKRFLLEIAWNTKNSTESTFCQTPPPLHRGFVYLLHIWECHDVLTCRQLHKSLCITPIQRGSIKLSILGALQSSCTEEALQTFWWPHRPLVYWEFYEVPVQKGLHKALYREVFVNDQYIGGFVKPLFVLFWW